MKTKEEIMNMIKEIDNGKSKVKDKKDIQYLEDVKAALYYVLQKKSVNL